MVGGHSRYCAVWQDTGEGEKRRQARLEVEAAARAKRLMEKQIQEARRLELEFACEKFSGTSPEFNRARYRKIYGNILEPGWKFE